MLAKPDKFQTIVLGKTDSPVSHKSNIIETAKSIKLLGFKIDHQLRFNQYISTLCSKAITQLNALSRVGRFITKAEKLQY